MTYVKSELKTHATADLQKQVAKELEIPDPSKKAAKAKLEENIVTEEEKETKPS